jgi:uncharacterized protein (DUF1778 family)
MVYSVDWDVCNDNGVTFCYAWVSVLPVDQEEKQMATEHSAARQEIRRVKDNREPLNMRVLPETRSLIDRAAKLTGKNRTDFILDAARQAAQSALLERTVIPINDKAYAAFVALLDAPPQPNDRLRKSLQTPAPWEK